MFGDMGGVIRLDSTSMTDYNSVYKCKCLKIVVIFLDNSALQGGVIKATSSNVVLNKTQLSFNYA